METIKEDSTFSPKVVMSQRDEAMIAHICKAGGKIQVYAKNIVPLQDHPFYEIFDMRLRVGEHIDFEEFKKVVLQKFIERYSIINLQEFTIEVFSKLEIKKNIEEMKLSLMQYFAEPTANNKNKFFKSLIELTEFNGFRIFGYLYGAYGLYNEGLKHVVFFTAGNCRISHSLGHLKEKYPDCKHMCNFGITKHPIEDKWFPVKKITRFYLDSDEFSEHWDIFREFLEFKEAHLLTILTRKRQIELSSYISEN